MANLLSRRLGCPACGTLLADLEDEIRALHEQQQEHIRGLERDLAVKRAKITRLQKDRWAELRASPLYAKALDVLKHWQAVCRPNAREIDSSPRLEAVFARLRGGHTVEELKLAADGYARRPFVVEGRRCAMGRPDQWHADAELIYRSDEHVRRGIAMASVESEPSVDLRDWSRIPWRRVRRANRQRLLEALRESCGAPLEEDGFLLFPCPRCRSDPALSLRVAPEGFAWLARCSRCGVDDERLLEAITDA